MLRHAGARPRYCARTYTQAFFPDFNGASTR